MAVSNKLNRKKVFGWRSPSVSVPSSIALPVIVDTTQYGSSHLANVYNGYTAAPLSRGSAFALMDGTLIPFSVSRELPSSTGVGVVHLLLETNFYTSALEADGVAGTYTLEVAHFNAANFTVDTWVSISDDAGAVEQNYIESIDTLNQDLHFRYPLTKSWTVADVTYVCEGGFIHYYGGDTGSDQTDDATVWGSDAKLIVNDGITDTLSRYTLTNTGATISPGVLGDLIDVSPTDARVTTAPIDSDIIDQTYLTFVAVSSINDLVTGTNGGIALGELFGNATIKIEFDNNTATALITDVNGLSVNLSTTVDDTNAHLWSIALDDTTFYFRKDTSEQSVALPDYFHGPAVPWSPTVSNSDFTDDGTGGPVSPFHTDDTSPTPNTWVVDTGLVLNMPVQFSGNFWEMPTPGSHPTVQSTTGSDFGAVSGFGGKALNAYTDVRMRLPNLGLYQMSVRFTLEYDAAFRYMRWPDFDPHPHGAPDIIGKYNYTEIGIQDDGAKRFSCVIIGAGAEVAVPGGGTEDRWTFNVPPYSVPQIVLFCKVSISAGVETYSVLTGGTAVFSHGSDYTQEIRDYIFRNNNGTLELEVLGGVTAFSDPGDRGIVASCDISGDSDKDVPGDFIFGHFKRSHSSDYTEDSNWFRAATVKGVDASTGINKSINIGGNEVAPYNSGDGAYDMVHLYSGSASATKSLAWQTAVYEAIFNQPFSGSSTEIIATSFTASVDANVIDEATLLTRRFVSIDLHTALGVDVGQVLNVKAAFYTEATVDTMTVPTDVTSSSVKVADAPFVLEVPLSPHLTGEIGILVVTDDNGQEQRTFVGPVVVV